MAIKVENLSYSYEQPFGEKVGALKNVSFSIKAGDFAGVMGHTGCGKTTLLQLLAGLRLPTGGRIYVNGEEINAKGYDRNGLRQRIGVVFQCPEHQLFATTVEKDVAFGLKHSGLSRQEVIARVQWPWKPWALTLPRSVISRHWPCPAGRSGGWPLPVCSRGNRRSSSLMSPSPGLTRTAGRTSYGL